MGSRVARVAAFIALALTAHAETVHVSIPLTMSNATASVDVPQSQSPVSSVRVRLRPHFEGDWAFENMHPFAPAEAIWGGGPTQNSFRASFGGSAIARRWPGASYYDVLAPYDGVHDFEGACASWHSWQYDFDAGDVFLAGGPQFHGTGTLPLTVYGVSWWRLETNSSVYAFMVFDQWSLEAEIEYVP